MRNDGSLDDFGIDLWGITEAIAQMDVVADVRASDALVLSDVTFASAIHSLAATSAHGQSG